MRSAGERARGIKKAVNTAAISAVRDQPDRPNMRHHADGSKTELDKSADRAQRRSERRSNHPPVTSTLPQVRFILNELSLGMALSTLAGNLQGAGKTRSRIKARAAYDAALRFADRVPLTPKESQKVSTALEALNKSLRALGESF